MIDTAILNVVPPLVAAVLTYIVANRRARIQHAKLLADIQAQAIKQVTEAEERMRQEIWSELDKVREQNEALKREMEDMRKKLDTSNELITTLKEEISSLQSLVDTYKKRITELERKKR